REFTETVQNLAAWLKKRDPRYKRFVEEQQRLNEEREEQRKRRVAEQRSSALEGASTYVRQAWEEVDYTTFLDEHFDETFEDSGEISDDLLSHDDNNDENDDDDHSSNASGQGAADLGSAGELDPESELVCIVCDKVFKTAAQKENHEQSKKHQKAVRELRREMVREERRMAKMTKAAAAAAGKPDGMPNKNQADSLAKEQQQQIERDLAAQMDQELNISLPSKSKKSKKKRRQQAKAKEAEDGVGFDLDASEETRLQEILISNSDNKTRVDHADSSNTQHDASKKELRRERQKKKSQAARGLQCNVCALGFETRNQLFKHINETGHVLASTSSQIKK
ncbi:hypothetical protein FB639_005874, partial [Coemansia asiatica]